MAESYSLRQTLHFAPMYVLFFSSLLAAATPLSQLNLLGADILDA